MQLQFNHQNINARIQLPGSKSLSNRLLILKEALNLEIGAKNISSATDTVDLIKAINQIKTGQEKIIDIGHAGTDMRFLTALLSIKEGEWIITGSERMKERPIKELVDALKQIGANISYTEKEGFPPLRINGKKLKGGKIEIDGSISSQYISALLLIGAALENGLEIDIKNKTVSGSYIQMTIDVMKELGINVSYHDQKIIVPHLLQNSEFKNRDHEFVIESDWSSASYWYSIAALAGEANITLSSLNKNSIQGDSVLPELYKQLGVNTEFENGTVILSKNSGIVKQFEYDFSDCPDIAQTIAVTCLGLNIPCKLSGLSTLKIKETNRLQALKNELEKFGAGIEITNESISIVPNSNPKNKEESETISVSTYQDHRMAMSFAPLALLYNMIEIENTEVVKKSYPEFWNHLKAAGLNLK